MHTHYNTKECSRMGWIDTIKIMATFMVLFQHSISHIWTSMSPETTLWKVSHFPFIFSRIAVLLFFMCSGATMLQRERSCKDIVRSIANLLKIYVSWMLVYGIVSCISMYQNGVASVRTCVSAMIKAVLFGHYHTWFIFALIGLYLITPFLHMIVQDEQRIRYFLLLSIIFSICIPTIQTTGILNRFTNTLNSLNMSFVLGYGLYYIMGYYISSKEWNIKYTFVSVTLFIISLSLSCFATMYCSVKAGSATQEILGDFSVYSFLTVISLFGIFKGLENIKFPAINSELVSLGYGIYLMHPLFLKYIQMVRDYKILIVIPVFYLLCVGICLIIGKSKILSNIFLK